MAGRSAWVRHRGGCAAQDTWREIMTHRMVLVILWLSLTVSGCLSTSNIKDYQPKNPEEARVVAELLKIPNGINSKSVDIIMQPYADDVYIGNFHKYIGVASLSAPRNITKAELRQAYTQLFKSTKTLSADMRNFQLTVSGDRAVAEARLEVLYKIEAGRMEQREDTIRNDVTWRLRNTPAGWKIKEEIFQ
jgi:ketosteroid isomerase-like protein